MRRPLFPRKQTWIGPARAGKLGEFQRFSPGGLFGLSFNFLRMNQAHRSGADKRLASLVATRLSRPAGPDGPVSELAKAMRIGAGRLQTMAAQATAKNRTAPMTPAEMTPERDFGPKENPCCLMAEVSLGVLTIWPLTTPFLAENACRKSKSQRFASDWGPS